MWKIGKIAKLAATVNCVSLQVMAAVVFFSCVRKYERLIDVCETLEKVYRDLRFTKSEVKIRVKVIVISTVAAIFLFSATFIQRLSHYETTARKTLSVISYLSIVFLYCTKFVFFVHFSHITQSITKGFRMVNVKLKEEIINHIVSRQTLNLGQRNVFFTGITRNYLSTVQKSKSLINSCWLLCYAVHQANDFYCNQLMAGVFSSFVNTTIMSFYCFYFLLIGIDNAISYGIQGAWILANVCYIVLLMNTSTEVTNSAEETAPMICNLINRDLDSSVREELEMFLLQLSNHNVRFSALGFFQIKNETLTAVIGAVTTYLVLLIEFETQPMST
ncbi:gustatory receptor [Homalodisca vitripennis]|nr:gustatory receptor [Homalodisca vitripennis]